jgi:hypothetical protein
MWPLKENSSSFVLIPLYRKMKWKKNRLIILLQAEKNLTHFMEGPFLGRITYTPSLNQEHPNCAKDCNGKFVNIFQCKVNQQYVCFSGSISSCHQQYPRIMKNVIRSRVRIRPLAWPLLLLNAQWMDLCFSLKNIASSSFNSSQDVITGDYQLISPLTIFSKPLFLF